MAVAKKSASEHAHPNSWKYVQIAFILALITAAEVALYYIKGIPDGVLVTSLFVMSAVKFMLVVLYFMHLKFDAPVFKRLFLVGVVLAFIVYAIVLLTFGLFR